MQTLLLLLALGQETDPIRAAYSKREAEIYMRDGKKLFTSIYAPRDASKPYPILLNRTPYSVSPYGADTYKKSLGPSDHFSKDGYIFVYQDVRGRNMSEGDFLNVTPHRPDKKGPADIDESTDAFDTIEWLLKNVPNHNGRVGMWGISYPGFYTAAGSIDAHPALKAISPQAPVSDWFIGDDFHHNGCFFLVHAWGFFNRFGRPRPMPAIPQPLPPSNSPDAYGFLLEAGPLAELDRKHLKGQIAFWSDLMGHGTYDAFWKARNLRPHLKDMKPAVMTVGGWFDAENLFGALEVYKAIEKQSPGATNVLVMGPWWHGQWAGDAGSALGRVQFGSKTGDTYRTDIQFPFFTHYLKGSGELKLPEAQVFETGANRWRTFDAWPPRDLKPAVLHFRAGGRLAFEGPDDAAGFDEYESDPARPVPYIAGQSGGMSREYMVEDQRYASSRPDVLVYRTEALTEDVTLAGPLVPSLHVSTTGTDSDWVVKLVDVYPDDFPDPTPPVPGLKMGGYQQLVRGEPFRGKYRKGFEKPEPFEPGKVETVEFPMPDVFHTFKKGHRIMVQVQSTWFPLVDRNPQKFTDIYAAKPEDFQKATQRVHRAKEAPSGLKLHLLK